MSKHIRVSTEAYNHLNIIKQSHYDNNRFSMGDALDEIIRTNDKLKQQLDWLMNKQT